MPRHPRRRGLPAVIVSVDGAASHGADRPGRVVRTSKTAMAVHARRPDSFEELLGAGVDPVHVLDDAGRPALGALARRSIVAQEHRSSSLQLRRPHAEEELRRGGHAEKVGEEDRALLALQVQRLRAARRRAVASPRADPLREVEVARAQLQDRSIRHGAPVGRARRLELQVAVRIEAAKELVEQARLADAGSPAIRTMAPSPLIGRASERRTSRCQLALASDQRRQPALPRHLEPGPAADLAVHGVGAHRLGSCP